MIALNLKSKFFITQWILTVALMFSVFLFSGYGSSNFQNARELTQIESKFDAKPRPEFRTISFWSIASEIQIICSDILSGYGMFQLRGFNSLLTSFLTQLSLIDNPDKSILFFKPKTFPHCSDEDALLTLVG